MNLIEVVSNGFKKYCYHDKDGKQIGPWFSTRDRAEKWLNEIKPTVYSNN